MLRGDLCHRLSDAQDADEVLHDVYLKALRDGRRF
jgi:DNA-directed RNA polymerase specialized sigma24 family protein